MTVSDLASALIRKTLVTRSPNPDAARSFHLKARALGVRTTNAAVRKIEALDDDFFSGIRDIDALHRALTTLVGEASG